MCNIGNRQMIEAPPTVKEQGDSLQLEKNYVEKGEKLNDQKKKIVPRFAHAVAVFSLAHCGMLVKQ